MGRWENTKTIHAFKGYWVSPSRGLSPEEQRIRELDRAHREAVADFNNHEITIDDIYYICDYYGVPLEYVKKTPVSTAEYIEEYNGTTIVHGWLENYKLDIKTGDSVLNGWLNGYDPNAGMTKQEYFREMKREVRKRGTQTPDQLIKLATDCGVGYTFDSNGDITFRDNNFEEIVGAVLHGQSEGLYHLSPAEQRSMIKETYLDQLRSPSGDNSYELCKTIVAEHYQINKTVNDKNKPIGKYAKFIHNFNDIYDGFVREGKAPMAVDIIERMDEFLKQTELYREAKRSEVNKKRRDTRHRNEYLASHPVKKWLYNAGINAGLKYRTDDDGRPILDLHSS